MEVVKHHDQVEVGGFKRIFLGVECKQVQLQIELMERCLSKGIPKYTNVAYDKDKKKLLSRIRRIKGQSEAIERALDGEGECEEILQLVASCRGALNGLMAELIEGHLRFHVLDPAQKTHPSQLEAAES